MTESSLPRCGLTDIPRLWCEHCVETGFTMTAEEQRQRELFLARAGEPPSLPPPPRDTRPGLPLPEYRSRPLFAPGEVTYPATGSCRGYGCDKPAGNAYLCPGCLDDVERFLADVPLLVPDLEAHAYGMVRFAGGGSGDGVRGISRASELIHQIHAELVSAVRHLTEERGLLVDLPDDTEALAAWLLAHARSIALDPAGPGILAGLHRWHAATLRAIDRPPDREYIGLCDRCKTPLRAIRGYPEYACPACRHNHDVNVKLADVRQRLASSTATVSELVVLYRRDNKSLTEKAVRRRIEKLIATKQLAPVNKGVPARFNSGLVFDLLDRRGARGA